MDASLRARRARETLAALPALTRNAGANPRFDGTTGQPLITVIIPTYNWSSVLRFAIASALGQTYPGVEVIVVGDGCTDDSASVVASFADRRVRWHNLALNSGSQSTPNNVGIELARGELIAYLGHDDIWLPTHLALVAQALLGGGADLAHSVTEQLGPAGSGYRALAGLSPRDRQTGARWIPPSAILHRKSLAESIGGWRDYRTLDVPPDEEFVRRAHQLGARFARVDALTVFKFNSAYRVNSYVEKPWHEQARYSRRIDAERGFLYRELAAVAVTQLRSLFGPIDGALPRLPVPPDPLPPGWHVTQYRRIRGLDRVGPQETTGTPAAQSAHKTRPGRSH